MVTRASAFERKERREGRNDGLRVTIEDASIASRMPFISSGRRRSPLVTLRLRLSSSSSSSFPIPRKLTLTKCHACPLPSPPLARSRPLSLILPLSFPPSLLLALTPISFLSRLSISRGEQSVRQCGVGMDSWVSAGEMPPIPSFPLRSWALNI